MNNIKLKVRDLNILLSFVQKKKLKFSDQIHSIFIYNLTENIKLSNPVGSLEWSKAYTWRLATDGRGIITQPLVGSTYLFIYYFDDL